MDYSYTSEDDPMDTSERSGEFASFIDAIIKTACTLAMETHDLAS